MFLAPRPIDYDGPRMVRAVDRQMIDEAVDRGRMLTLTTYTYFAADRDYIDNILNHFLEAVGHVALKDKLSYCIHELANNAKKANTKRVYFAEKGLDISNESQYYIGMQNFRDDSIANIDYYIPKLRESGLYIKVQFKLNDENLMIAIRNNVRLTAIERSRIEEKIRKSREYENMAEAYASIEDSSEGAGLGIVMMIIMLRNLGLSEKIIRFFSNQSETFALLTIPRGAR